MAFRLRDEAKDEIREETRPEPSDVITAEDAFPDEIDAEADADEPGGLVTAVPGPVIAAATFVPTFLVVFFSLSSLMGAAGPAGPPANAGASTALKSDLGAPPAPTPSEALRDPFVDPRLSDATPPSRPPNLREAPSRPAVEEAPAPTIESARPSLPPARPRETPAPAPAPRARRSPEPPQQPQAAVLTAPDRTPPAAPAVETPKGGRDWTPAAAFADREAANRLANSIRQQGYPVEIRQEQSATRPWVVWIGAQPRGGDRRR